jgi:hypothetical protein
MCLYTKPKCMRKKIKKIGVGSGPLSSTLFSGRRWLHNSWCIACGQKTFIGQTFFHIWEISCVKLESRIFILYEWDQETYQTSFSLISFKKECLDKWFFMKNKQYFKAALFAVVWQTLVKGRFLVNVKLYAWRRKISRITYFFFIDYGLNRHWNNTVSIKSIIMKEILFIYHCRGLQIT